MKKNYFLKNGQTLKPVMQMIAKAFSIVLLVSSLNGYAQNYKTSIQMQDVDGDGVHNGTDLDNDNDGILDTDEGKVGGGLDMISGTVNTGNYAFSFSNDINYVELQNGDPSPLSPDVFMNGYDSEGVTTGYFNYTFPTALTLPVDASGKINVKYYFYDNIVADTGTYSADPTFDLITSSGTLTAAYTLTNKEKNSLNQGKWIPISVEFDVPANSSVEATGFNVKVEMINGGTGDSGFDPNTSEVFAVAMKEIKAGASIDLTNGTIETVNTEANFSNISNYIAMQTPAGDSSPLNPDIFINGFDNSGSDSYIRYTFPNPIKISSNASGKLNIKFYYYDNVAGSTEINNYNDNVSLKLITSEGELVQPQPLSDAEKTILANGGWIPVDLTYSISANSEVTITKVVFGEHLVGGVTATFDSNNSEVFAVAIETISSSSNQDTDGDGVPDYLDLDSDNDGIPDAVEAQTTAGYQGNDGNVSDNVGTNGVPVYGPVTPQNTDNSGAPDFLSTDSDGDGILDIDESGITLSGTDANNDGIDDALNASYQDPDGIINNPSNDLSNEYGDTSEVAYRETTPSAIENFSSLGFKYYPNPIDNVLNISAQEKIARISIVNTTGQEIKRFKPNSKKTQINLSQIPGGIYLMKVTLGNKLKIVKIQVK